jgi:hypothetical protein
MIQAYAPGSAGGLPHGEADPGGDCRNDWQAGGTKTTRRGESSSPAHFLKNRIRAFYLYKESEAGSESGQIGDIESENIPYFHEMISKQIRIRINIMLQSVDRIRNTLFCRAADPNFFTFGEAG